MPTINPKEGKDKILMFRKLSKHLLARRQNSVAD